MSQTFISGGDTNNLVWEEGSAILSIGHGALTPPQPGWCWEQPHLPPADSTAQEIPTYKLPKMERRQSAITSISYPLWLSCLFSIFLF